MILKKSTLTISFLLIITWLIPHQVFAQETYNFRFSTLDSIVNTLEKQLPVRFYFAPSQTDTLLLNLQAEKHKAHRG